MNAGTGLLIRKAGTGVGRPRQGALGGLPSSQGTPETTVLSEGVAFRRHARRARRLAWVIPADPTPAGNLFSAAEGFPPFTSGAE